MRDQSPSAALSTHGSVPALLRRRSASGEAVGDSQPPEKWLVPVDGTAVSMSAIEYVIAHAETARTHVYLVNVQPAVTADDVRVLAPAKVVAHMRRSTGKQALSRATALLDKAGFKHTSEVVFGTPAEGIVRSAAERHCTRIVMGSKATGAILKIFHDSVFSRVLKVAHVPVTAIKVNMRRRLLGENDKMVEHHEARKVVPRPTADISDFRMSAKAARGARATGSATDRERLSRVV